MRRQIIFLFTILIISSASAQNSTDALRYSRIFFGGTARFQGLAGAFSAAGADYSVTATNPAGIGLYKSFEMTFTPSLLITHANSNYNGVTGIDNRVNFGVGDIGLVFSIPNNASTTSGFRSFTFAFGMNRQNDFNSNLFMEGKNTKSSMLTGFCNTLNSIPGGISPDRIYDQYPFDIGLAYNTDLIFYDTTTRKYLSDFDVAPTATRAVFQKKSVSTYGSINEMNISFATNFEDKLYFGATIGVPFIRYFENSRYEEYRADTSVQYFRSMVYDQSIETHGVGINFKAGLIYRPASWFRVSGAIHTPTYYGNMKDNWSSRMTGEVGYDASYYNYDESPLGYYEYEMSTPFRAIGGLAFIVGSYGMITGEYEYVNYNQARFYDNEPGQGYQDINDEIKAKYASPVNVRAGTEWRIRDFRLRGGFGYYGSPYSSENGSGEKYLISGGVGYRSKHFFFDLTYVYTQTKDDYYFYDASLVNPSFNTITSHSIVTTFGVRF